MSDTAAPTAPLPDDMREWIEGATGGRLVNADRQAGGGRKQAWFVDIQRDGATVPLFLRWDPTDPDAVGDVWTVRREALVYRALRGSPVPVAQFISLHPTRQAMLATRVTGRNWFSHIKDPAEQVAVATDFITHLAALHRLDVRSMELPGVDPQAPVAAYARQQLDEIDGIIRFRGGTPDPVLQLALGWLRANVPSYDGPAVLVQGDTGPGNFMYEDGRVTAIVDWELAHPGDPMDDIAWVSLRAVQEPFTDLRERFREYESLSGHALDLHRILYYRVLAEAKIMVMGHGLSKGTGADAAAVGGGGDPGAGLVFGQLHRRLCAEALAAVLGIALEPLELPVVETDTDDARLFDAVLSQLRHVVTPRITDSFALQRTKGLARVLKYLAARSTHGPAFAAAELDDLEGLLGQRPTSVRAGRLAVSTALADGRVDPGQSLQVLYRGIQRDNELLRDASGALADRHYEPPV